MDKEENKRLNAIVIGRVQGVSFRYYVVELAESLNLRGWVRNKWNGSVEVTAEGSFEFARVGLPFKTDIIHPRHGWSFAECLL